MRIVACLTLLLTLLLGCTPEPSAGPNSSTADPTNTRDPNVSVMDAGKIAYDAGDYATAFIEWSKLADKGDPLAMNRLGTLYSRGHGVDQDQAKAIEWYERAADGGEPVAQSNLAQRYFFGEGVEVDKKKAELLWRKAADQDYAKAQATLALMYSNGEMEKNYLEAERLALRAAAHGNSTGQYVLGQLYANGHGVEQDEIESLRWHRLAADQGDADSQIIVGSHLMITALRGNGTLNDLYDAKTYFQLAADQDNQLAKDSLANVEEAIALTEASLYLGSDDIESMVQTYRKNQARFKRDYVGQVFKAKLPLFSISENTFMEGHWTIELGDGIFSGDVKCKTSNPADVDVIADWNKGDVISVSGEVADVSMGSIELGNCNLAEVTSS